MLEPFKKDVGFLKKVGLHDHADSFKQMWQMGGSIRDYYLPRNFMTTYDGESPV